MELTITRNKFGELAGSPIFQDGKVIFPVFENPELAKEGEVWEAELVKLIPLNKVDRKGKPMFKGVFRLILPELPAPQIKEHYYSNGYVRILEGVSYIKYYRVGGKVKADHTNYYFYWKDLPVEIADKYKKEIETYKRVMSIDNKIIRVVATGKVFSSDYNCEVDLNAKKLKVWENIEKEVAEYRGFVKDTTTFEVVEKEFLSRRVESKEFELDIDVRKVKRIIERWSSYAPKYSNSEDNVRESRVDSRRYCYTKIAQIGYKWTADHNLPLEREGFKELSSEILEFKEVSHCLERETVLSEEIIN